MYIAHCMRIAHAGHFDPPSRILAGFKVADSSEDRVTALKDINLSEDSEFYPIRRYATFASEME